MVIVSDTTAIASFLRAGRQALLKDLFGTLVIPRAVARELDQAPELLGGWRERLPFVGVVEVPPSPILRLLLTELDSGEAEAICLAQGGLWLSEDLIAEFHRLLACD